MHVKCTKVIAIKQKGSIIAIYTPPKTNLDPKNNGLDTRNFPFTLGRFFVSMFLFVYIYIYVYVFLRMFLFQNPSWWSWDFHQKGGGPESGGYPKMTTSTGCTQMAWFKLYQFQLGEYPMVQPDPLVLENLHMKVTVVVSLWCMFLLHYFFLVHVRNMRYSTVTPNRNVYISGKEHTAHFWPQIAQEIESEVAKLSGDTKNPRRRTCCYPSTHL